MLISQCWRIPKFNDLELKILWSIPTIGRHVPTKRNLKIHYSLRKISALGRAASSPPWCK